MTKRNTFFKTLLLILTLLFTCSACLAFSACSSEEPTIYKLYQFDGEGDIYEIGDDFYGMKLDKNFVKLTLDEDGDAELKISIGFLQGNDEYKDTYQTYKGSYTETKTEIIATFPDFRSSAIHGTKTGNFITLTLGYENIILKK